MFLSCLSLIKNAFCLLVYTTNDIKVSWHWNSRYLPLLECNCQGCSILQTGHITLSSTPDQQLENHSMKYHRQQPLYNTLELLMMGIVVPETCWAIRSAIKTSVASSWHFISTYYVWVHLYVHIFRQPYGFCSSELYWREHFQFILIVCKYCYSSCLWISSQISSLP